jgi:pyruvate/2-oxoglutarate dehydrogenase complex dihydrolipoamide acyltransferase (E2) component
MPTVRHLVEIRKYLAPEGSTVNVGTPIVVIENYWAVMTLKANGKGILRKTFFERGTSVSVEMTERKRQKPSGKHESS